MRDGIFVVVVIVVCFAIGITAGLAIGSGLAGTISECDQTLLEEWDTAYQAAITETPYEITLETLVCLEERR